MAWFQKESLEKLRDRVDIVEVVGSHIEIKRSGATFKALCPFHEEKTASFVIQKGDKHYHCFGCGAHGDAIQFLMSHLRMTFSDAVERLAEKFQIPLEKVDVQQEDKGVGKGVLREALDQACRFYHFYLLHTSEGKEALRYLMSRGVDLGFIRRFQLGLAPKAHGILKKILNEKKVSNQVMVEAGLLRDYGNKFREFFNERIMFPIRDSVGTVIGFSGRVYHEGTKGGKYVNTSETALFKKSKILFGLDACRRRIAKEQMAIIVEGQLDTLRLIHEGLDITVSAQGTAFGQGHVRELKNLGVQTVFLALDADDAGWQAAEKIGNELQAIGIEVKVAKLPFGSDPDSFVREKGIAAFVSLLQEGQLYLLFMVERKAQQVDMLSPAGKNLLVRTLSKQIRSWQESVMVHESLRQLAHLVGVPESVVGVNEQHVPHLYVRKQSSVDIGTIDPDLIMEADCLRWILISSNYQKAFIELLLTNLTKSDFILEPSRKVYETIKVKFDLNQSCELSSIALDIHDQGGQQLLEEIGRKRIDISKAKSHFLESLQRILNRNWMAKREAIQTKLQSGSCSDEEATALAKDFDALKSSPPQIH